MIESAQLNHAKKLMISFHRDNNRDMVSRLLSRWKEFAKMKV